MYSPAKCIKCGTCVNACSEKAITLTNDGIITDPDLCKLCGKCADVCPTLAIEMSGKIMSVDQIMETIEKDRIFYDQSGGGVTFSGGEPLTHKDILIKLLDKCKEIGIHTAVDTAGNVSLEIIKEVASRTNLFLYDLKMMDSKLHKKWTTAYNDRILQNLEFIAKEDVKIIFRIPLIGEVNDTEENIELTAKYVAGLPGEIRSIHLLPYHTIAQNKYNKLGKPGEFENLLEPTKESQARAIAIFLKHGIPASIGG